MLDIETDLVGYVVVAFLGAILYVMRIFSYFFVFNLGGDGQMELSFEVMFFDVSVIDELLVMGQ